MLKICSREEFINNVNQYEAIFCFGAGRLSKAVEREFKDTVILEKIIGIVDNDLTKEGTSIQIENYEYAVYTPDIFAMYRGRRIAVIITCLKVLEILRQLEHDTNLCSADFYYIQYFRLIDLDKEAMQKEIPDHLRLSEKPEIPKVIHYCWFGNNPIPDKDKAWMESWHKFCPDYEIKVWNESNYDITKNEYMYQAYKQKRWGFVPDYARLDIIYNYGGIYLDTDIELVGGLDELLFQKGFAGFQSTKEVNLGSGFGAKAGLPIVKEMRDYYEDKQFINGDGSLNLIASPALQTSVLLKHGLKQNGEYQIVEDLTIFPEKMFCGKSLSSRMIMLKPYTRAIHYFDASWQDKESQLRKNQLEIILSEAQFR